MLVNKRLNFQAFLPMFALALLLFFAYLANQPDHSVGNQCQLGRNGCEFSLGKGHKLRVEVGTFPLQLEETWPLILHYPTDWQLEEAWIEGVNMYMGKSPLILLTQGLEKTELEGFLGSCSEPKMRWRMVIRLRDSAQAESRYYVNFQTQR